MSEKPKRVEHQKLPREVIRALQDVVGPEWVSEDRAVVEAYTLFTIDLGSFLRKHTRDPSLLPSCVVLPSSTEEVQAIVKIANRYNIPFAAFNNGQVMNSPVYSKTIFIHLARMDKILDIDEENMSMTIQPFVDYVTIQAEARKRGLWNGGSGWHSATAKPASQFTSAGLWQTDLKYQGLSRNVLGIKVVLPTGEIVNMGSHAVVGTGKYSFTERFPGPKLMGLIKNSFGTRGIITEITIKLHPWVGGAFLPEDTGRPSIAHYYEEAKQQKFDNPPPPKRYKLYWFEYPNLETLVEGLLKIARSGIGIGLNASGFYFAMMCARTSMEARKRIEQQLVPPYVGYVVIAGISCEDQIKYEEKVLKQILEETGGRLLSEEYKPDVLKAVTPWNLEFAVNTVTGMRTVRDWYLTTSITPYAPFYSAIDARDVWAEAMKKIGPTHDLFSPLGAICPYLYIVDRGHQIETEIDQFPKRNDFKQLLATLESFGFLKSTFIKKLYYGSWMEVPGEPFASSYPETGPNMYLIWRKYRKVFDPKGLMMARRAILSDEEFKKAQIEKPGGAVRTFRKWREILGLPKLKPTPDKTAWEYPAEPSE